MLAHVGMLAVINVLAVLNSVYLSRFPALALLSSASLFQRSSLEHHLLGFPAVVAL